MKSVCERLIIGRCGMRHREPFCSASMAAVACLSRDEDDMDFCSMTSDMLRFFKIGFLIHGDLEPRVPPRLSQPPRELMVLGWRGP